MCDGCGQGGQDKRFRCVAGCDFDYCEACNAKAGQPMEAKPPKAILLELEEGGYYELEGPVTAASVEKLLADFKAGTLTKKSLSQGEDSD